MAVTVHIFQSGEWNGVNAKDDGKWLEHDDAFSTFLAARTYAVRLARRLGAQTIVYDWDASEHSVASLAGLGE